MGDETIQRIVAANHKRRFIIDFLKKDYFNVVGEQAASTDADATITIESTDGRVIELQITPALDFIAVNEVYEGNSKLMLKSIHKHQSKEMLSFLKDIVKRDDPKDPEVLKKIVAAVAEELNKIYPESSWKVIDREISSYLILKNTATEYEEIGINSYHAGKGKLAISGHFPWINGRSPSPSRQISINVADTKTPAQIAKDIQNRLMLDYRIILAECVKKELEEKGFQDNRINIAKELNRLMGSEWKPHMHFDMNQGTPIAKLQYPYGELTPIIHEFEITAHSDTSINIKLNLKSASAAKAITRLIMLGLKEEAKTIAQRAAEPHNIPDQAFIDAARSIYESDIEIDSDAQVSRGDSDGSYVEGWLWVSNADAHRSMFPRARREGKE